MELLISKFSIETELFPLLELRSKISNISIPTVSRTVTRCLMEELDSSEGVQVQYSLNPLLPPACVPFVELIGLEAGKFYFIGFSKRLKFYNTKMNPK